MSTYDMKHLSEPWFTLIKIGSKKVEGRLNKGWVKNIEIGDYIEFYNDDFGFRRKFLVKVTKKKEYKTFYSYLKKEKLYRCLPGITSLNEGVEVYYKYYTVNDENQYGIISLTMKVQ